MDGRSAISRALYSEKSEGQKERTQKHRLDMPERTVWLFHHHHHHHHHHQSLNREGRWGTTDDFATICLHFSPFSTALWDLPNSRPVHSLMLPSYVFLCLPCLLPPFIVPCKILVSWCFEPSQPQRIASELKKTKKLRFIS